jgi:hypothetical protein
VQGAYRIHVPNVLCTMSPWDGFSRIPVFITVLGSVLLDDGWAHPSVFRFLIAFWVMCHKVSWSSFFPEVHWCGNIIMANSFTCICHIVNIKKNLTLVISCDASDLRCPFTLTSQL